MQNKPMVWALSEGDTKFSHAELHKIILEDGIESSFTNVDIAFRIFLTLLITICSSKIYFLG